MKIEERLHDAMREYADTIEPEPGSWNRISARFDDALPPVPTRPSRRPRVLAGVALALVVVLITALVVRDDGEEGRVVTDPTPTAAMPSRILAVSAAGQLVVLDAKTSQRITGSTGSPGIGEGTQIAVVPNGTAAYVVQGDRDRGCVDTSIHRYTLGAEIGPAAPVVAERAKSPTVSPDGRYLAYLRCSPGDARAREIVLRDLRPGINGGAAGLELVTPAPVDAYFGDRLEFAADSQHVQYRLVEDAAERLHEIDIVAGEPAPGRAVDVVPAGEWWAGVRGTTGEVFAWADASPGAAVSAVSASSDRRLFTLPAIPHQVVSDRSGRHVLALVGADLYRWSEGDREPTKLVGNYIGAAWIPDPPMLPARDAVAVLDANRVVVLDDTTGSVKRELFRHAEISGVTPAADGKAVYVTSSELGSCPDGPETFRVPLDGGEPKRVFTGVTSMRERSTGEWPIAVTGRVGCADSVPMVAFGRLDQADAFIGGGQHPYALLPADTVSAEILDWSPDGRTLIVRVERPSGSQIERIDVASGVATAVPYTESVVAASFNVGGGENDFLTTVRQDERGAHLDLTNTSAQIVSAGPVIDGIVRSIDVGPYDAPDDCCRGLAVAEDGRLFEWTGLMVAPIDMPGRVTDIAWLPNPSALPDPPPSPARAVVGTPERVVVGMDGRLAVLSSATGQDVPGPFGEFTGLASVSSRFNESTEGPLVFFTSTGTSSECGVEPGSDVSSMYLVSDPIDPAAGLRNLETRRFVGGAQSPVVSPDGKFVAYGLECGKHRLGMTRLKKRYERFRIDPLGDSSRVQAEDTVGVLGWSPDSKQILYRVWIGDNASPRYFVSKLPPVVPQSALEVRDMEVGRSVVAATFIDNKTLAFASSRDRERPSVVHRIPLTSDGGVVDIAAELFEVPGYVTSLVADVSGNHFLALNDNGALYRWSTGDSAPTKLADGVTAAAWLPDPPAPDSSVRFGTDAAIPLGFPSAVPLPDGLELRSTVSEKNPPDESYTMTYSLGGRDHDEIASRYRTRLERAGFTIEHYGSVGGSDSSMTQFEAIGEKWDVKVVSGRASPRDRPTLSVQVYTHGRIMPRGIAGIGDTNPDLTTTTLGP